MACWLFYLLLRALGPTLGMANTNFCTSSSMASARSSGSKTKSRKLLVYSKYLEGSEERSLTLLAFLQKPAGGVDNESNSTLLPRDNRQANSCLITPQCFCDHLLQLMTSKAALVVLH